MAFKINSLVNHWVPEVKESMILRIIGEYTTLKQKLDTVETQSWYFQQSINNQKEILLGLKNKFESIKSDFNVMDVDDLIEAINEKKELYKKCTVKTMPIFAKIWGSQAATNQINYFSELLSLKSKIKRMESIDYYVDRPDEVMNFV